MFLQGEVRREPEVALVAKSVFFDVVLFEGVGVPLVLVAANAIAVVPNEVIGELLCICLGLGAAVNFAAWHGAQVLVDSNLQVSNCSDSSVSRDLGEISMTHSRGWLKMLINDSTLNAEEDGGKRDNPILNSRLVGSGPPRANNLHRV